mmetsp:Transcript_52574/g.163237  ORF Transcript_52574/g.163237 Transcript_52574/m.163237 type:complete len:283 (-) Transcript_52574:182-1030(-)
MQRVQEAGAAYHVAHPVVAIRRRADPVKSSLDPLDARQDPVAGAIALQLHEPQHCPRVGVADALLAPVIGKHLKDLCSLIGTGRARQEELGVQLRVSGPDLLHAAGGHQEAQHGDALPARPVPGEAGEVRGVEVVPGARVAPGTARHVLLRRQVCNPMLLVRRDHELHALRVRAREHQAARRPALAGPCDAPAEADQDLLYDVLARSCPLCWLLRAGHGVTELVAKGNPDIAPGRQVVRVGRSTPGGEGVELRLERLVLLQGPQGVRIEVHVGEAHLDILCR